MFRWFFNLLSGTISRDQSSSSLPCRRASDGRPSGPMLRKFGSVAAVRSALEQEIDRQQLAAAAKSNRSWYWGNIGAVEQAAITRAQAAIARVPAERRPERLVINLHQALEALAAEFRSEAWDADGYGLGTIHAIKRVLEDD